MTNPVVAVLTDMIFAMVSMKVSMKVFMMSFMMIFIMAFMISFRMKVKAITNFDAETVSNTGMNLTIMPIIATIFIMENMEFIMSPVGKKMEDTMNLAAKKNMLIMNQTTEIERFIMAPVAEDMVIMNQMMRTSKLEHIIIERDRRGARKVIIRSMSFRRIIPLNHC